MIVFLTIIYIITCIFLISVVLLQGGKGGGLGAAFGSGVSQQIFGGVGAGNILTKMTTVFAILFMVLSAVLAYLSSPEPDEAILKKAASMREIEKKAATEKSIKDSDSNPVSGKKDSDQKDDISKNPDKHSNEKKPSPSATPKK